MTPQAPASSIKFVAGPPGWLRWGGGTFLAVVGAVLAIGAVVESIWPLYAAAAGFLLSAGWWCFMARITVTVDGEMVTMNGPLWKRSVQRKDVRNVTVAKDDGMNTGLVNWPVTRHGSLTRLNMGGSGAVVFSEASGHYYQVVLADLRSAEQLALAIGG